MPEVLKVWGATIRGGHESFIGGRKTILKINIALVEQKNFVKCP